MNWEKGQTVYFTNKQRTLTKIAEVVRVNKKTVSIAFHNPWNQYKNPAKIDIETGSFEGVNDYYSLLSITKDQFKQVNFGIKVDEEFDKSCSFITQLSLSLDQKKRILKIVKEEK